MNISCNNILFSFTVVLFSLLLCACEKPVLLFLTTIADARNNPAHYTDIGEPGDSAGDILTFDQPLLDSDMKIIGNNSGSCIRTHVGLAYQCQWTLTFIDETNIIGVIQVAGREKDEGTSTISIVGGSGKYSGIVGEMKSTNNNDGTFTQVLNYSFR